MNTHNLLKAFIKASGYEIEEVNRESLAGEEPDVFLLDKNYIIDYKVTKCVAISVDMRKE